MQRKLSLTDRLLEELQHGLSTCHVRPPLSTSRAYPANAINNETLSEQQQKQVASLMRANNAGEVAAQGLYRGQAITARNRTVSKEMLDAAEEENEHLNWCQQRLSELNASRSKLDGLWYWGSFSIGALAGLAGDKWSLGFVEETEIQVGKHLDRHLSELPEQDQRSRAIIETMKADELRHAENAHKAGAAALPQPVKTAMTLVSKLMTFSASRL